MKAHYADDQGKYVWLQFTGGEPTMHPDCFDLTFDEAKALRDGLPNATITLKPLRVGFEAELYDYSDAQKVVLSKGVASIIRSDGATPRSMMQVTAQLGQRDTDFILQSINRWE